MQYSMLIGPFQNKYLNGQISISYLGEVYSKYNTTLDWKFSSSFARQKSTLAMALGNGWKDTALVGAMAMNDYWNISPSEYPPYIDNLYFYLNVANSIGI